MAELTIESNGRIEKTAVYFNGEQLGGIKELFIHIDENGTFDDIIQYVGIDKQLYTKRIFSDYLTNIQIVEPTFTEEEARNLKMLLIESDGDIENTYVYDNDDYEYLEGVVSVFIHIKSANTPSGLSKIFKLKKTLPDTINFNTEIIFREDDDTLTKEFIF